MANDKSGKPKFEAMPEKAATVPAPATSPVPTQADLPIQQSAAPAPLQAKATAAPEPLPAPTCDRFKVLETSVFSIGGQITTIQAGAIVCDATHGPGAVKRMLEQKIKLEKV